MYALSPARFNGESSVDEVGLPAGHGLLNPTPLNRALTAGGSRRKHRRSRKHRKSAARREQKAGTRRGGRRSHKRTSRRHRSARKH